MCSAVCRHGSFHYYHFVICHLLPSISVKCVVYVVCTKLLGELLSIIRFPRSSDNLATNGTSPHSPMQQPTLLILVYHPPELPLFSREWTCQIREQKTMETNLDNDKDKSLVLMKYFQLSWFI